MQKFTQKYVLVQMIKDLPIGYEYAIKSGQLQIDDIVTFDSITLVDMFPDENPCQRRILGTVHFAE
jgi:hypothetical protein